MTWAGLCLSAVLAVNAPAAETVLVFNIAGKAGVTKEYADTVTQYLAGEASKRTRMKVVTLREVEGTMSAEQLRQVAGCDSVSCAAEIGGALSTDQIVIGDLAKLGDSLVLTMARVRARDATVMGRINRRFKADNEILDAMPNMVAELFASELLAPVATAENPAPTTPAASPPADKPVAASSTSTGAWVARVVGGLGLGLGGLLLLPALGSAAVAAAIVAYDVSKVGLAQRRAITATVAVGADVAMLVAGVGLVAFVVLSLLGAAALGASLVL